MSRRWLGIAVMSALSCGPGVAYAQDTNRAEVQVRQVAGENVYLDIGTLHGLERGDTLAVAREADGPVVGRLVVTAASDVRAVLAVVGEPFSLTRGGTLVLHLRRAPTVAPPAPRAPTRPQARASASRPPASRRPTGRLALDVGLRRSATRFGGADPVTIERSYATPALRLDMTVPDIAAGFRLRTSMRLSYRYSDATTFGPSTSARIYSAALERTFTGFLPAQVILGRFYNPVEVYSGFWDGAMLRLGGRQIGLGAVVGFEPDRWNEAPSTDVPKATVFTDWRFNGVSVGWRGDVSVHAAWPGDSLPDHRFAGLSQRLRAGPLTVSQDLQVDRDLTGSWKASRISARASLAVTPALSIRGSATRRESYLPWRVDEIFAPQRDRIGAGLALRAGAAYASFDVTDLRDPEGPTQRAYSGFLSLPAPFGASFTASVSHSTGENGEASSIAPAFVFGGRGSRVRLGYRIYRSAYLDRDILSHAPEVSVDLPMASGLRASIRLRGQFGDGLRQEALQMSLIRIF